MELALYCPIYGYYEKEGDKIGRRGDFYTSVSVGSLFGELLAHQVAAWFEAWLASKNRSLGGTHCHPPGHSTTAWRLVEAGTHAGQLASDLLRWLRGNRPLLFEALEFWILEPSDSRRRRQERTLGEFSGRVNWAKDFEALSAAVPATPEVFTVVLSNELLDAFPAHRFGWDANRQEWFEWGIGHDQEGFQWSRLATSSTPPVVDSSLLKHLPDGFTVDVAPAAADWWAAAAELANPGKLVTFDYGLTRQELFSPERFGGTLRGYRDHRVVTDVLNHPGDCDLTTHVDFTSLEAAGNNVGLVTEFFDTQEKFLTRLMADILRADAGFGDWTTERTRRFQTLTHPAHFGRSFRVLVQSRI